MISFRNSIVLLIFYFYPINVFVLYISGYDTVQWKWILYCPKSEMLKLACVASWYIGGSRVSQGAQTPNGAPSPKVGVLTYYFAIFCQNRHENDRIWTPKGVRAVAVAPSPPDPLMEWDDPWFNFIKDNLRKVAL